MYLFPTRLIEQSCPSSTPFSSGTSDLGSITPGSIKSAPPCSFVNTYGPVDAEGSISGHFHRVYTKIGKLIVAHNVHMYMHID